MVVKYDVVESRDLAHMQIYVNERIEQGWEPQGGICIKQMPDFTLYIQAMVKDIDEQDQSDYTSL